MKERIEAVELEKNKLDREKERYKKLVTLAAALQALGYHRKCPACAIFRIHSDWSKISENTYGPTLENYQSGRVVERDRLKRKVDDCVRRLRDLHNLSRGVEDDIALKKSECRECRSELNTLNEHLKDARRRYVTANTEWRGLLKRMGKEATLHGKMHDAKHELDLLEEQLNGFEAPIEELRNARATQAKVKSELEAAEEEFKKREAALVEALDSARGFFNKTAKALLLELGLKGFQEVTIDENFQIRVVREDCVQEAIELSSSESATLTILLALAAKRAYFPTVPFFAVDTITTSYNLTAHRRLMEFLGRELREHVVVTMLAPKEHELKVVHTIPALVTES
jgi:DNA repair exonuclease SbcCD ATPase subunit